LEAILRNRNNYKDGSKGYTGLTVEVRNGDFNKALRIFKKKVQEAGIIQEVRERQQYVKPSEQRAKAKAAGRARWLKKQRQMEADGIIPPKNIRRIK
jgi:small subunit ribosomal protein S21